MPYEKDGSYADPTDVDARDEHIGKSFDAQMERRILLKMDIRQVQCGQLLDRQANLLLLPGFCPFLLCCF